MIILMKIGKTVYVVVGNGNAADMNIIIKCENNNSKM